MLYVGVPTNLVRELAHCAICIPGHRYIHDDQFYIILILYLLYIIYINNYSGMFVQRCESSGATTKNVCKPSIFGRFSMLIRENPR